VSDEIIKLMADNGGIRWAEVNLNMTRAEAEQMLDDAGKAECQGCQHIFTADVVDENDLCENCAPCEYCE
jgi:hypothetical protein